MGETVTQWLTPQWFAIGGTALTLFGIWLGMRQAKGASQQLASAQSVKWRQAFGRLVNAIERALIDGTIDAPRRLFQLAGGVAVETETPVGTLNVYDALNSVSLRITESGHLAPEAKSPYLAKLQELMDTPAVVTPTDDLARVAEAFATGDVDSACMQLQRHVDQRVGAAMSEMTNRFAVIGRALNILQYAGTLVPALLGVVLATTWYVLLDLLPAAPQLAWQAALPVALAWGLSVMAVSWLAALIGKILMKRVQEGR